MKRRMTRLYFLLGLTVMFLTLSSITAAETLHSWFEAHPDSMFDNGDQGIEQPFNTYTSKSATRSESGGSWQLTASATASAGCQAVSPAPGNLVREWDVDARLRATGDRDREGVDARKTRDPLWGNELPATEAGVERTKTSTDGTTTARTKRVVHIVMYQNRIGEDPLQRSLDASTSGGKSETSVSQTDLDADPWASSWMEVRRRIATNEVVGTFESKTPKCSSSGAGHTCEGATPPPKKRETVYCARGEACGDRPGVEGKKDAHQIDCPERTYKQGAWAWLMLKIEEDCKGEKWNADCHSDPTNCTRKHLHLKPASEASSGETVFNGYVVPAGYSVGACGEHLYPSSGSASDHAEKTGACGHTYYACTPGDHDKLQASCSTDTNCISTNFYLCQHTSHTYGQQACGHTYNPGSSSANSHRSVSYPCGKHSYYACQPPSTSETNRHTYQTMPCGSHSYYPCRMMPKHKVARTCPTDSNGQSCSHGSYYTCSPHTHAYPSSTTDNDDSGDSGNDDSDDPGDSSPPSSPNMITCDAGHSYRADHPSRTYLDTLHRTRTCRRSSCGRTWQPCTSGWAAADCPASTSGGPCWGTDD